MQHKIIQADYHRNGVGGKGFYVALVESDGERYLCVDFTGEPGTRGFDAGAFAVLRVDDITAGNIGMYPITDPDTYQVIPGTGNAAYRGDHWEPDVSPMIRDWMDRSVDAFHRQVGRR